MAEPELRRASDPRVTRKLHSAIKKTCEQKQSPIFERVFRALAIDKVQVSRSRVEMQLKNSIRDGIIVESNPSSSQRGKSMSEIKSSYRVPSLEHFYENYEDDGHDWYCWVCHREGEVYLCSRCPRVIHKKCAEVSQEELTENFVCYCCKDLESTKQYGKKELHELATMLVFTVERMKSKCEELWKSPQPEDEPTYKLFVYKDTNLNDLEKRVRHKEFDSLAKFHYEIEWLFHNAVIFYGGDNKITSLARMVVLDGQNELSQIDICTECYIKSNQRPKNWFSQPCSPQPHRIVYAKLGNDPPWPAKVLRVNDENTNVDVRFFGPPYQRAWIPSRNIWELDEKPIVKKKRSKALSQAEDQLKIYLRLLAKSRTAFEKSSQSDGDTATEEEIDDDDENDNGEDMNEEEEEEEIMDNLEPPSKMKKQKDKNINIKKKCEHPKRCAETSQTLKPRKLKAERRFRELQEARLLELSQCKTSKHNTKEMKIALTKIDINKNISKHCVDDDDDEDDDDDVGDHTEESPDSQLAQQIKMTDDYKMIEKLQEHVRKLEKSLDQARNDYELAQADLESTRIDLAAERQRIKRLQEQVDSSSKGHEINVEKMKNDLLSKRQEELEAAVEEERKRNELEFEMRLKEAIAEERNITEAKLKEERAQLENKAKLMTQREREELQRNFERYKHEQESKQSRAMEETMRKVKVESDEMTKRALQENLRRIQVDTERLVSAAKKKSWCANCTKEAFYHCCWNTNYCSTECQRIHWVTHRYQCTREMMSTCRSCQQRQNFAPGSFTPQVPPK